VSVEVAAGTVVVLGGSRVGVTSERPVRLPSAPMVRLVRRQRAVPASRDPARPRRAVRPRARRGWPDGVLGQHDDARVRGFFRFAHLDGLIPADPAVYARRPKVLSHESRTHGLDRLEVRRRGNGSSSLCARSSNGSTTQSKANSTSDNTAAARSPSLHPHRPTSPRADRNDQAHRPTRPPGQSLTDRLGPLRPLANWGSWRRHGPMAGR